MKMWAGATVLFCAVSIMAAGLSVGMAGTHHVARGHQGPQASTVRWEFVAEDYGRWQAHVVNSGLKSLVIEVYDNSTGVPEEIMHQRLRFADLGAFPSGAVDTGTAVMAPGRPYIISATPFGPKGAYCDIEDAFDVAVSPVATFTATVHSMTVSVSAMGSYDPDGIIVSYAWSFGDGSLSSGVEASHTYDAMGVYDIGLWLRDNDGLTNTTSMSAVILDRPPAAVFTYRVEGRTVFANASGSSDDYGIVTYEWDWGDGTGGCGVTADHTYAAPAEAHDQSYPGRATGARTVPYLVMGYTMDSNGNVLGGCDVKITDMRTGVSVMTSSDLEYGFYSYDLFVLPGGVQNGDAILVEAETIGSNGSASGVADLFQPYLLLDLTLVPSNVFTVTLTVTDEYGHSTSASQVVTLPSA